MVGRRAWGVRAAVVLEVVNPVLGRRGEPDQAGWLEAVVRRLVPFVAQNSEPSVVDCPLFRLATRVLRQNRIWPSTPSTSMSVVQQLTVKIVPVRLFSGRRRRPVG